MKKLNFLIPLLLISAITCASGDFSSSSDSFLNKDKNVYSLTSGNKILRKKSQMPNLFLGAGILSYLGRHDGVAGWSAEGYYNHELFSIGASSAFSFDLYPLEKPDQPNIDQYYTTFNITQAVGTYFFYSYRNSKTFRAFTGKIEWRGNTQIIYYKKQSTSRENKIGARIGFLHDQENIHSEITTDFERPNDYEIISYKANSVVVGISKSTYSWAKYRNRTYFNNGNMYFDFMIKLSGSENYKLPDENQYFYTYHENLDLFDYRLGWRFGVDRRSANSPFPWLNQNVGFEIGTLPVPKYGSLSGFYIMLKMGFTFNLKV